MTDIKIWVIYSKLWRLKMKFNDTVNKDYIKEMFIKYAKIQSNSSENNPGKTPSTPEQIELGKIIVHDLKALGVKEVEQDKNGYVIARIKGNTQAPTVAFISHLDTYHSTNGKGVEPIVHENYNGKDIVLPKEGTVIKVSDFPELKEKVGKTLISSSGDTLLGGDDKCGIAISMEVIKFLLNNTELKHGDVCFVFTPDEEIGHGAELLDLRKLNAVCAYTLDSEGFGTITNETFCANYMTVDIKGKDIHPGYAKNKMVNALRIASRFIEKLPTDKRPETTEERQGFLHPVKIEGGVSNVKINLLVRDFAVEGLKELQDIAQNIANNTQKEFQGSEITISIKEQYRNMRYELDKDPRVVEYAVKAMRACGVEPKMSVARGGTDGSRLSYRGLLTPDIPAGFYAFHSKMEWVCLEEMAENAKVIRHLISTWAS